MNVFKKNSLRKKVKSKDSFRSLHSTDSCSSINTQMSESSLPEQTVETGKMKFSWCGREDWLKYGIFSGQSAIWGNVVYFKNGGTSDIYEYNSSSRNWTRLPPCSHVGFSLVIIEGLVTAVGGFTPQQHKDTDKILGLVDGHWQERYPPMPTARHYTTAVVSGNMLIVAGGSIKNNSRVATVEILDISKGVWSKGIDLPFPLSSSISTVCTEHFYVLGGFTQQGKQSSVAVCCSVKDLIRLSTPADGKHAPVETRQIYKLGFPWREMPDAPLTFSTCVVLNGSLVLTGGMKHSKKASGEIYRYDSIEYMWELIGLIPTPRYCSVAAIVPTNRELLIVGGLTGPIGCDYVNLMEMATF